MDVSATELRLNYLLNKNNVQVHAESVKELNNHVNCIRNKMKNPQVDGQKIYQEYLEGGHPNPSSLEDLRYFLLLSPLLANPGKLIQTVLLKNSPMIWMSFPEIRVLVATRLFQVNVLL